jgi:hypothetical protein
VSQIVVFPYIYKRYRMAKELLLAGIAFGLFVVCPRIAGMMHIIASHVRVSMLGTVLLGMLVSVPLLVLMVLIFNKFGTGGALAFCVFTDFGAAFVIKEVSLRAGEETIIIALFIILGVKIAPVLSKLVGC